MRNVKSIGLAMVVNTALAAGAMAADAPSYPAPVSTSENLQPYDYAEFDWNRFYVGLFGATQQTGTGSDWQFGGGINAGINMQQDFFLLGAEAAVLGLTNSSSNDAYGQILGRGGVVLTDEIVAYGALGYGLDLDDTANSNVLVGGGLEMAVTDDVSLRGQYLYGFPIDGSPELNQITFGANFHF